MKFEKEAEKLYKRLDEETEFNGDGERKYYMKRRVYPIFNRDGSINWFNLCTGGSWFKLLFTIFIIAVIVGFIIEYHNNFELCRDLMSQYNNQTIVQLNPLNNIKP